MKTEEETKEQLEKVTIFLDNQICINDEVKNAQGWKEALEWVLEE